MIWLGLCSAVHNLTVVAAVLDDMMVDFGRLNLVKTDLLLTRSYSKLLA